MDCLDDETVLEVVSGALPRERLAEVRAHLDACPACRILIGAAARNLRDDPSATPNLLPPGFDDDSTVPLEAAAVTSIAASWPILSEGDLVDRYRLDEPLGEGGHGVVWAATHTLLHKQVALKILKSSDPDQSRRFLREARIAATLRHPNLVEVYDILELPGGMLAMVMERLHGESLGARVRRRALTIAEVVETFTPIVDALRAAHGQGIVHRDLKPHNIFLAETTNASRPIPKVLDFGLAKLTTIEARVADGSAHTRSGVVVGTPQYMAPEQFLGDKTVDERADVWSLGVILFECITGKRVFATSGFGPLLHAVTVAPLPDLATRAPEGTPAALVRIVGTMMARDRAERPPLADVSAVLVGLAI